MHSIPKLRVLSMGLFLLTLVSASVFAQRSGNRLEYGSSATSQISEESPLVFYTFSGSEGDQITIRVIPTTDTLDPTVSLLSPAQQPIVINNNDPYLMGAGAARISYQLPEDGIYSVVVGGGNNTSGEFLILLNVRESVSNAPRLTLDDAITVDFSSPRVQTIYRIAGDPDTMQVISLAAAPATYGFAAEVRDSNGQPIAILTGAPLSTITLPAREGDYVLDLSAPDPNGSVTVSLSAGETVVVSIPEATEEPIAEDTATATLTPVPQCVVVASETTVNVRSGPGTGFPSVGFLRFTESLPVVGLSPDGGWVAVDIEGERGWVASAITQLQGTCGRVESLVITATPTPILPTPTPSTTPLPTMTLTPSPSNTPTITPTLTPTVTLTPTLDPVADAPYDEDYTLILPFYTGTTFTEQISFPGGDHLDVIAVQVEGFNALNTRTEYSFRLDCVGSGTDGVLWGFDLSNPDKACGDTGVIVFTPESNDQRITITLPEGSPSALVYYTLVVTKL